MINRDTDDYIIGKLKDPAEAEAYLNASLELFFEDYDTEVFFKNIELIIRSRQSITEYSKISGINRQHLYNIFRNETSPLLKRISILF